MNCILTNIVFQTVADEKRVVDEQRRTLDEEIADFQRRKVGGFPLSLILQSIVDNNTKLQLNASQGRTRSRKGSRGSFF